MIQAMKLMTETGHGPALASIDCETFANLNVTSQQARYCPPCT
jgi:hypothetical protein